MIGVPGGCQVMIVGSSRGHQGKMGSTRGLPSHDGGSPRQERAARA
jgi:hypothetical protein